MRKYLSFFKIRFLNGLQYRMAAYAGIVTQFAWGFLQILMFKSFYESNTSSFPMSFSSLTTYIWLQQALLLLFMIWSLDTSIFEDISSGNIAYELIRPLNIYNMWFTKNFAMRLSKTILRCIPIILIGILLPYPYGISMPYNFFHFVLFIMTMILAFFLVVAFCMLIYITTFYTLSPLGVRLMAVSITEILTGALIPLPFLPEKLQFILSFTPFYSMQNLPFRIYSGHIAGIELISSCMLQVFWLVSLLCIGKLWMKKALKKVVVQGG